jgi:hypothetical protein
MYFLWRSCCADQIINPDQLSGDEKPVYYYSDDLLICIKKWGCKKTAFERYGPGSSMSSGSFFWQFSVFYWDSFDFWDSLISLLEFQA